MTFEDALDRLGIEVTATRKEVRRAYLKLIKVHKPDRDPEGFQQVREAFELVDDQIEWRRAMAAPDEPPYVVESDPSTVEFSDDSGAASFDVEPPDVRSSDGWSHLDDDPSIAADNTLFWSTSPPGLLHAALDAIENDTPNLAEQKALRAFEVAHNALNAQPPSAYDAIHLCLLLYVKRYSRQGRAVAKAFLTWLREAGAERELLGGWAAGRLAVLHAFQAMPGGLNSEPLGIIASGLLDDDVNIEMALYSFARDKPYASMEVREALERHAPHLAEAWAAPLRRGEDCVPPEAVQPWHKNPNTFKQDKRPPERFDNASDGTKTFLAIMHVMIVLGVMSSWRTGCDQGPSQLNSTQHAELAENLALQKQWRRAARRAERAKAAARSTGSTSPLWQRIYPSTIPSAPAAPSVDLSGAPAWLGTFCKTARAAKCEQANSIWTAFKAGQCVLAKKRYAWLSTDMMLAPELRTALKRGGKIIRKQCRSP